jgi:hypothetical protein
MIMDEIIENIVKLYEKYGEKKIDTDKKLMLMYWKDIDECKVTKAGIDTGDFINKSTDANLIINGIRLYRILQDRD